MPDKNTESPVAGLDPDWRARTGKQQRKYLVLSAAAFAMAIVICFLLFLWFQNRNYNRIIAQNMNYIQDSAIAEATQMEHELYAARTHILNLARQYGEIEEANTGLSVEDRLVFLRDETVFDRIAFIYPDGTDVSLEGTADVSDRRYFLDAMEGNTGWEMLEKSRIVGRPVLVFYSPVIVNNEIAGVMVGFYDREKLENMFSYELFNHRPDTYLLAGDGAFVAGSRQGLKKGNLLQHLSEKRYIGEVDYDGIIESVEDTGRTTITFSFVDGSETSVGVIVQFMDSDWMLLSILSSDITNSMVNNANKSGAVMLTELIVVFFILSVLLFIFFVNQRRSLEDEIEIAEKSLKESLKKEARQFAIVSSLADTYSGVYYLDLITSTYYKIKDQGNSYLLDTTPDRGDIHNGFRHYIETFVATEYQDAMKNFMDLRTIEARLEENTDTIIEYQRQDKKWRRATLVATERDNAGNIISAVFASQQIDKEKERELRTKKALEEAYEAARNANNAKTKFLSNMSHDIRTPMNAIVGMTAIAGANIDNAEKVKDCLKKITYSSKHLLGLINEVLDMSKIESGKVDLIEEEFNLADLIGTLITLHQPLVNEKAQNLIVKINNVAHEDVIGDRTRLLQVLTNFLSNAIKYTGENGTIEIYLSEKDTNRASIGWYEVIFKDNGIGMTKEFMEKMFEPFARADDERVAGVQGTGLGMAISKNIISMMSGNIKVESELNEGSKFTVSFALKLQSGEEINYEEFIDLPVLVADDDKDACETTCTILDELSMRGEYVLSGREAVERVVRKHIDHEDYYAVIVDWKMPDMNGVETAKEIRRQVGEDLPIIVISAYDWSDIEQEAREAGVSGFLSKPLFKSRIVSLFNEIIGENKNDMPNVREELSHDDFSGHRVLLVEDNEINREMAVEFLSMVNLETETAENGKLAVEKFAASAPGYYELIFMDIQMPVMDGYDATVAIRALDREDAKTIPIVAMTANAFATDVRHAYDCGMNGHIAKPIDMHNVVKALNENIKEKK